MMPNLHHRKIVSEYDQEIPQSLEFAVVKTQKLLSSHGG